MAVLTNYETGVDSNRVIGDISSGGEYQVRKAMSFKIPSASMITTAELYLRTVGGITDPVTVSIQTNNGGVPSGTLVNASATTTILAASVGAAYDWEVATFPASFALQANTTYHLVATVPDPQATNVSYDWGADGTSPGYANGSEVSNVREMPAETYNGWAADANFDFYFRINGTVGIASTANFLSLF